MDIFIIKIVDADNVHMDLLKEFQKKEISNSKEWNAHCFSYLMTDRILREFYQIENRKIIFKNEKPYLENKNKFFNISRSEDYVAIAFSDSECAICIEKAKDNNKTKIDYNNLTFSCAQYKLNQEVKQSKSYNFDNYILTAVSENEKENFEIYLQSGEVFPQ